MRLLIAREARTLLELGDERLETDAPTSEGFFDARVLADRLSALLPVDAARATGGEVYALARFEQALRTYLELFLAERDSGVLVRALGELDRHFGSEAVDDLLAAFQQEYLQGDSEVPEPREPAEFLEPVPPAPADPTDPAAAGAGRGALLGEILILSIVRSNPAFARFGEVLHQSPLTSSPGYEPLIAALNALLAHEPALYSEASSLIGDLRRPLESAPDSAADQLDWILGNWESVAQDLEPGLLAARDLIAEEQTPRFPPGPGPIETPTFDYLDEADVHYATDRSWMSDLVLAAKNTYVWLHQLSERHGRPIRRLDQIPDTSLKVLAESGFTGLWLIGLWERSQASRRIKQLCGNPEAAGSAYSLLGYRIAAELGGDEALENLKHRAANFGIRLSADMVPNHTGIDSDWMMSHPDWFLSVDICPFPSYTFNGPDLSSEPAVGIFLEDHYYDRTDAAVVFKRIDRRTGEVRFVYHGNDGTGTPWNDTAQLDYLNPELREAVTQTIIDVAAKFPIIRFDAAMTLAKRHVQRLWYPEPGSAGAIPSRAEHTLTPTDFNAAMPTEFWRSVVDRTESEAPNTLLMAEAFWLMEGYFVRNLGLHRVYNSSFMNLLRDGDNVAYRKLVQESLELDPEILRRSVNFLSNPDERSALEQFGNGDRYFGACALLATMPGLPMFAHGQVEGLAERYGMEYRRAYTSEKPNQEVIERHEREISPLLRERRFFSSVESFGAHDFVDASDRVDDNVIAYSNRRGDEAVIVVFNNSSQPTRGSLVDLNLGLDLGSSRPSSGEDRYFVFRDRSSGKLFLRPSTAAAHRGLEFDLAPYQSLVLEDFRVLAGTGDTETEDYGRLSRHLGLSGTVSLEVAQREAHLADARAAFGDLLATLSVAAPMSAPAVLAVESQLEELDLHLRRVLEADSSTALELPDPRKGGADLVAWLEAISRLAAVEHAVAWPQTERMLGALEQLLVGVEKQDGAQFVLPAFALLGYVSQRWGSHALEVLEPGATAIQVLAKRGVPERRGLELAALIEVAASQRWLDTEPPPGRLQAAVFLETTTSAETAGRFGYDPGSDAFATDALIRFLAWRATAAALGWLAAPGGPPQEAAVAVVGWCDALERLRRAVTESDNRIEPVLARLRK